MTLRSLAYLLLIMLFPACPALAQEIFFLSGGFRYNTDSGSHSSQGYWSVGYSQGITDHTMFSITYLNEGHQPDHARDGLAPQIWLRTSPSKVSFALGAGPYLFFDTISNDNNEKYIRRDVGLIGSATATWYGLSPFLLQARADYIHTFNDYNTFGWTVGVGYLLGDNARPASNDFSVGKNEIDIYLGTTILNVDHTEAASAAIEYRRKLLTHLDWSVGLLYEGDKRPVGRYGITTELWLAQEFFHDRLTLGIGAGPYIAHDKYGQDNTQRDTLAGIISLTGAIRFTPNIGIRAIFHRIATDYDGDADVLMGGLAITF